MSILKKNDFKIELNVPERVEPASAACWRPLPAGNNYQRLFIKIDVNELMFKN